MDLRIEEIFNEEMKGDKSFMEKESGLSIFFGRSYTKKDLKETWDSGIKYGIEIGLRRASLEGQSINIRRNIKDQRHKEFYEKFIKLANEYNCAIQYHPQLGMCVIDTKNECENF